MNLDKKSLENVMMLELYSSYVGFLLMESLYKQKDAFEELGVIKDVTLQANGSQQYRETVENVSQIDKELVLKSCALKELIGVGLITQEMYDNLKFNGLKLCLEVGLTPEKHGYAQVSRQVREILDTIVP